MSTTFFRLRFDRPDPQGAGNRKMRVFWAILAQGGLKTEKHNYPALRVPKSKNKSHHAVRDVCLQLFYALRFAGPDPHVREIAKCGYFRPFWPRTALGTWRNPGAGPKTEKCNFPVLGALLGGKSGRPKSFSPKVRNFFALYVLADRTPTGGKSENAAT